MTSSDKLQNTVNELVMFIENNNVVVIEHHWNFTGIEEEETLSINREETNELNNLVNKINVRRKAMSDKWQHGGNTRPEPDVNVWALVEHNAKETLVYCDDNFEWIEVSSGMTVDVVCWKYLDLKEAEDHD